MWRAAALAAALLSAPAAEEAPPAIAPVTIISNIAASCSVTFTDPMLGIAWARVVLREMPPEKYLELWGIEYPNADADKKSHVREFVDTCMGAPA